MARMSAAGSTITENIPADALAIARGKQTNKQGWAKKAAKNWRPAKKRYSLTQENALEIPRSRSRILKRSLQQVR